MFITKKNRKTLVLVVGLMFLAGLAETASASCSIEKVCKLVKENKDKKNSLSKSAKADIESQCNNEMHNSDCPVDQVIKACLEEKSTDDVVERCKEIE